jgi:hypothetical protein
MVRAARLFAQFFLQDGFAGRSPGNIQGRELQANQRKCECGMDCRTRSGCCLNETPAKANCRGVEIAFRNWKAFCIARFDVGRNMLVQGLQPKGSPTMSIFPPDHYVEIGAALFPLQPGTKIPFKDFNWKSEATKDPARWRQWPSNSPAVIGRCIAPNPV